MLKSVEGIYDRGEIQLQEKPDDIPPRTKVIVTFLTPERSDSYLSTEEVLSNEEIDKTLQIYRQENKFRPLGLCTGQLHLN